MEIKSWAIYLTLDLDSNHGRDPAQIHLGLHKVYKNPTMLIVEGDRERGRQIMRKSLAKVLLKTNDALLLIHTIFVQTCLSDIETKML